MKNLRIWGAVGIFLAIGLVILVRAGQEPRASFAEEPLSRLQEGFLIDAGFGREFFLGDEEIPLKITLVNQSEATIVMGETLPEADFTLIVKDQAGQDLSQVWEPSEAIRHRILRLEPGKEKTFEYRLSKAFDTKAIGEYTITARRDLFRLDGEGLGYVESNPVYLSVTKDAAKARPIHDSIRVAATSERRVGVPLVAVRPLLERHGFEVTWVPAARKAVARKDDVDVELTADADEMVLRGRGVRMCKPAQIVDGQLMASGYALSQITALGQKKLN